MKEVGKVFLATSSTHNYTDAIMTYVLGIGERVTRELDPRYLTARGQPVPRRLPPDALLPAHALRRPLRRHLPRHPALPTQRAASGGPELVSPCRASLASLTLCPRRTRWSPALPRALEVTSPSLPPPGASGSRPCRELWVT
ncbi:5'-nucleotidase domain-containing protein 4 isoform X1 [Ailuropoda melanoleuca]|uniref:5'-nucleotidase domain-containing protein 4 isoform X1 n=1 Tax=Ailuropoda melanoleuca TaxID=9646 RepID=UPI001494944F|nr:5'-nucleotidase domain-containing protein 4 isoform X1 [Ailuropoda melanoleuca]